MPSMSRRSSSSGTPANTYRVFRASVRSLSRRTRPHVAWYLLEDASSFPYQVTKLRVIRSSAPPSAVSGQARMRQGRRCRPSSASRNVSFRAMSSVGRKCPRSGPRCCGTASQFGSSSCRCRGRIFLHSAAQLHVGCGEPQPLVLAS